MRREQVGEEVLLKCHTFHSHKCCRRCRLSRCRRRNRFHQIICLFILPSGRISIKSWELLYRLSITTRNNTNQILRNGCICILEPKTRMGLGLLRVPTTNMFCSLILFSNISGLFYRVSSSCAPPCVFNGVLSLV